MIRLESLYVVAGLMFASFAVFNLLDRANPRRVINFVFWGVYAVTFLFGGVLPHFVMGCLAIALALIAGTGKLGRSPSAGESGEAAMRREQGARRFGNRLFIPALLIPAVTLVGTLTLKYVPFIETKNVTLISLVLATLVAFAVALAMLRDSPTHALKGARHTMDAVGWAAILPQMLASLGAVFTLADVGKQVGIIASDYIPLDQPFEAVIVFCFGMAAFTAIMGNAFAAFPVMTAAIGLPLIVVKFHGNPAIMGAIGMLSGFCGTLTTPMAANFNVVPAALLELPDKNGVIKAQLPTAGLMLIANMILMYCLAFRF